jgi:hypothetical protein
VASSDERMKISGCPPYSPNRKLKSLPNIRKCFQAGGGRVCAPGSRRGALASLAKLIVAKTYSLAVMNWHECQLLTLSGLSDSAQCTAM